MKLALTQQAGVLPEMALTPQLTIPTSGNASTTGAAWPGLNWLYSWEVTERLSLAGSTQGNAVADDTGEEHLVMIQSAVLGWAITEPLGTCIEWFGLFPSGAATAKPEHYLDTCLKYLVTDDIQLDIRFGLGLNEAAADYFTGAGVTVRFR
jgi:hypothetical protein